MDEDEEEITFSDRFACNICGYSLTELEPRLFSFNNPTGACPSCDGLGVKQFFDPERVVVNLAKTLAAYQETLVTAPTPFDAFRDAHDDSLF